MEDQPFDDIGCHDCKAKGQLNERAELPDGWGIGYRDVGDPDRAAPAYLCPVCFEKEIEERKRKGLYNATETRPERMTRQEINALIANEIGMHNWPDGNYPDFCGDGGEAESMLNWLSNDQLFDVNLPGKCPAVVVALEWIRVVTGKIVEVDDTEENHGN